MRIHAHHHLRHQELRHDEEGARLARSHGVDYAFHDYKTAGIERERLERWDKKVGWETLLNRAGTTFRKLPDKDKQSVDAAKAIKLMLAQPSMIKRPVLDLGRTGCWSASSPRPIRTLCDPDRMDEQTLAAYDTNAAGYARDWHDQPPPSDLHAIVKRFFRPGLTADIGCGSGREVAWLAADGYPAIGYDVSEACSQQARARYPDCDFRSAALPAAGRCRRRQLRQRAVRDGHHASAARAKSRPPCARLLAILKPAGILYLSWRVTQGGDHRDASAGSIPPSRPASCARRSPWRTSCWMKRW